MIVLTCVVLCYSRGVIIDGRLRHTARPYRTAAAQVQRFGSSQGTGQAQTAVVFFIFVPTGRLYHCINRQSNLIALGLVFYIDCNICFSTIKPLRGRADTHWVCAFVHGEGSVGTERNGTGEWGKPTALFVWCWKPTEKRARNAEKRRRDFLLDFFGFGNHWLKPPYLPASTRKVKQRKEKQSNMLYAYISPQRGWWFTWYPASCFTMLRCISCVSRAALAFKIHVGCLMFSLSPHRPVYDGVDRKSASLRIRHIKFWANRATPHFTRDCSLSFSSLWNKKKKKEWKRERERENIRNDEKGWKRRRDAKRA